MSALVLLSACNLDDVIDEFKVEKEEEVVYTNNDGNSEITKQLSYPKNIAVGEHEPVKFSVNIPVDNDTSVVVAEFFSQDHELLAISKTFVSPGDLQTTATVFIEYGHSGVSPAYGVPGAKRRLATSLGFPR